MKTYLAAALIACAAPAAAQEVVKASPLGVTQTADGLVAAIEGAGATVFARVDHAAGAASVGQDLPPAELVIFGNPALGTLAMQDDIRAGLVLPLRVLVYQDANGATQMTWDSAQTLFDGLDIAADADVVGKINGALNALTDKAMSAM